MIPKKISYLLLLVPILLVGQQNQKEKYNAGFMSLNLKDKGRIYKPETSNNDSLHFRPVDLDIWYPSNEKKDKPLIFGDLFKLFEERAVKYQENNDFSGLTSELAQFYVAELGVGTDGEKLLEIKTNSFGNITPSSKKHPVIIYMAGFNGMGFENYKVLESLAENGFVVVSIWSVGRYPGDMTNEKEDMQEQVYDAEFALNYLRNNKKLNVDLNNIGILAYSWGGMAAGVLSNKNQNIKTIVSFDGTETHYFGEVDTNVYANGATGEDNDLFIKEIYDSNLLNPQNQNISYLYFESGDKLNDFQPTEEYNYFKKLNSEKFYLRFENSTHSDFTSIPSILNASITSVKIYENINTATVNFFNKTINGNDTFTENWETLIGSDSTNIETFDISEKTIATSEISGKIIDAKTRESLSYVNIGVLNGETGTVTDIEGNFILEINDQVINDTLRISMIGYKPIEILIKDLKSKKRPFLIELTEHISELNEVVITTKALKKKIIGNKTKSKFLSTGFSYDQLGAEMGIKINIRKEPTFVDAFNFNISYNRLSAKSIFRINFYSVKNNKPFENILTKNILVEIEPKQTGLISIDLKSYHIVVNSDIIVTLEWVDNEGENKKGEAIFFSLGLLTNGTIYKKSSQAEFKKYSSMGVGFNIDIRE
ncbi:carboxypeptidase-like regulatory domain-containing protein [Aquimarina algiphila]|uniref:carboxypeptidase-like regulatory domain-containing protein n=1 Tax=Aquimarina algiphila TaxID=2047982 RepID=UPI002491C510|nr:carboxypeptidase-like regulatory domain-containing protein [Aquimarina algiphila]